MLADAADLSGAADWLARNCIWLAAVLMAGGFFLSAARPGATEPNRLIVLVYAGAVVLAVGVVTLGIGLL